MRQDKIHAKLCATADDFRFRQLDERRVNFELQRPFDAGLRGQIRQLFESRDVFRPAIGIAAVIDGVDADENIGSRNRFGKRQGQRKSTVLRAGT